MIAVRLISYEDASLLIMGNSDSPIFPKELLPYTKRTISGSRSIKQNFPANYGWQWDLSGAMEELNGARENFIERIHSSDINLAHQELFELRLLPSCCVRPVEQVSSFLRNLLLDPGLLYGRSGPAQRASIATPSSPAKSSPGLISTPCPGPPFEKPCAASMSILRLNIL